MCCTNLPALNDTPAAQCWTEAQHDAHRYTGVSGVTATLCKSIAQPMPTGSPSMLTPRGPRLPAVPIDLIWPPSRRGRAGSCFARDVASSCCLRLLAATTITTPSGAIAAVPSGHLGHPRPDQAPSVRKSSGASRVHGCRGSDAATPLRHRHAGRDYLRASRGLAVVRDRALLLVRLLPAALRRSETPCHFKIGRPGSRARRLDHHHPTQRKTRPTRMPRSTRARCTTLRGAAMPAAAMVDWLANRGDHEGPVIRTARSRPQIASTLRRHRYGRILRKRAAEAGLGVKLLSAHSLPVRVCRQCGPKPASASPRPSCYSHRNAWRWQPYVGRPPPSDSPATPAHALSPLQDDHDR